jgi:hypothetical protein
MAAAFSNSLVGVAPAVLLTVLGVVNNVTDMQTAVMTRIETVVRRRLPCPATTADDHGPLVASFGDAVQRCRAPSSSSPRRSQDRAAARDLHERDLVVVLRPGERR